MLYKVSIPSITHDAIIKYLKKYNLINKWKDRPTFRTLLDKEKTKIDMVYTAVELEYNYRGDEMGKGKEIYFSLHEYGKFMYPYISTILNHNLTLPEKIVSPDIFFKKYYGEAIVLERTLIDFESIGDLKVAKKYKDVLERMIYEHHGFCVHIRIEDACFINNWWYLKCLLVYNSVIFQHPYINKEKNIKKEDKIYPYHLFKFVLLSRNDKIANNRFKRLDKRIMELTPKEERKDFLNLSQAQKSKIEYIFYSNTEEL